MISEQRKTELLQQLEQISPQWTAVLRKKADHHTVKNPLPNLNIMNTCCCIVGEAHGFSDKYELTIPENDDEEDDYIEDQCQQCDSYCTRLIGLAHNIYATNQKGEPKNEKSWSALEGFIEHFNGAHKK